MGSDVQWSLGAETQNGPHHQLDRVRDLTQSEVADLGEKLEFVEGLAIQPEFHRLLRSAQSWKDLLDRAVEEGAQDGLISESVQRGARRELLVFSRLLDEFVLSVRDLAHDDPEASSSIGKAVSALEATEVFRRLQKAAQDAKSGRDFLEVDPNGDLVLIATSGTENPGIPTAAVGFAGFLIPEALKAIRPKFEVIAAEVDHLSAEIAEIAEGPPGLIGVVVDSESGEPKNFQLRPIPVREVAVLRAVYRQENTMAVISILIQNRLENSVTFGGTSSECAIRGGQAREGVNSLPEATFDLRLDLIGAEPVDFWAPVNNRIKDGPYERDLFSGVVQTAEPDGATSALTCEGAAALTEHMTGRMVFANIEEGDLVRSMMAQSGCEDAFSLSDEPGPTLREEFEVLIPAHGMELDLGVSCGAVELISGQEGAEILGTLEISKGEGEPFAALRDEYLRAAAYFRAIVTATTPDEAEDEGLGRIETALAWLTIRGRYGEALLPDGEALRFQRTQALRAPERGAVVLVLGRTTRRQWLRWPDAGSDLQQKVEASSQIMRPSLPSSLPAALRQSLLALRLAATQRDPTAQAIAIWQAIESFAAKTKCRKLFSEAELDDLREMIPAGLDTQQREVLGRAIGGLNAPPVRERMLQRLRHDGIPLSQYELSLLDRLRKARNDAVHGRVLKEPPTPEEANYGIGIVARMLVHRVAALGPSNSPVHSSS